jgi:flagellar FliJ protein
MTRSERIQPIKSLADEREREAGRTLSRAQAALEAAEKQLAELSSYRAEYAARQPDGGALDVARLQNLQAFLGRLEDAIRQQQQIVDHARVAADASGSAWRERKIESASLGKAVNRLQAQERAATDRREQAATDERASRARPTMPD